MNVMFTVNLQYDCINWTCYSRVKYVVPGKKWLSWLIKFLV